MTAMDGDVRTRKDDAAVVLTENVDYVHAHTAPSRENDSFELKPEEEAVLRRTRVWHKWEQLQTGESLKYANYNFGKRAIGEDRKLLGRLETIKANKANADKNKNKPEILVAEGIRFGMTIPVRVRVSRVIVNEQACHGQGKGTEKKGSESVDLWLWKFWDLVIQHMQNGKPSLLVPN
jgi:hypothetical protein